MSEWESDADFYRNLLEMRSQALSRVVHRAEDAEATVRVLRGAVKALLAKDDPSAQEMAQKALDTAYAHARKKNLVLLAERDEWKVEAFKLRRNIKQAEEYLKKLGQGKNSPHVQIARDLTKILKEDHESATP